MDEVIHLENGFIDDDRIIGVSTHSEAEKFLKLAEAKEDGIGSPRRVRIAVEHYLRQTDLDYKLVVSSTADYVVFEVSKINSQKYAVSQKTGFLKQYLLFQDIDEAQHRIEEIGGYCISGDNKFLRVDADKLNWGEIVR